VQDGLDLQGASCAWILNNSVTWREWVPPEVLECEAGQYRVTLAAAVNASNGSLLSQGFAYDSETPIPLALWNQPTYDPNANDQKGGFWQLRFSQVDSVSVVPEPASWLLLGLGVAALSLRRRLGTV
jgi:hypothetical protein